jgi:hypothetical protein
VGDIGKKRHILVDTVGLLIHAVVHPADIQDRDGGILVMASLFGPFPFLKKIVRRWRLSGAPIQGGARQSASRGTDYYVHKTLRRGTGVTARLQFNRYYSSV